MRYWRLSVLVGAIFLTGVTSAYAEFITDFSAEYQIMTTGEVLTTETIVYDFGFGDRHGIFRDLEKKHPQGASAWYKNRLIDYELESVTRNGQPEPYDVTDGSRELSVKIGSADSYVTGSQTYTITYKMVGALSYGNDGAEFYYNVTGNNWPVLIGQATAKIISEAQSSQADCYQGVVGATTDCSSIVRTDDTVTFTAQNLLPGEGLTIASEIDSTKVAFLSTERWSYLPLGVGLTLLTLTYLLVRIYRFRVRNKTKQPIIAQYEPYPGYLPMYTGLLLDQSLDARDITAGILYLAEQGFFKITKIPRKVLLYFEVDDYQITLMRPLKEIPTEFLKSVSELLYSSNSNVKEITTISKLVANRTQNASLILKLKQALKTDLTESGFTTVSFLPFTIVEKIFLVIFYLIIASFIFVTNGLFLVVPVFIVSIILLIIIWSPRRTAKGYEALNHIQGFKLFLSVTDKDRLDFHNAPESSPELFMKFLPYAVALGVEEKWAKVFAGITIPNPDWYEGGDIGTFSALTLTKNISAFSSSFSSSSGTSGSSGGGSSGGGGGGGGGGSW